MAYATTSDVQARLTRTMSETETAVCGVLLDDAAVLIDACGSQAPADAKKAVSCRMVLRALGDGGEAGIPPGASQGTVTALGYSQSWTISGGGNGELYLTKAEKRMLGTGNRIGAASPLEDLAERTGPCAG